MHFLCSFGQMPQATDTTWGCVGIIDMPNSLNIHLTGIHALGNLFSISFYEIRDQDEISRTILEMWVLIGNSCVCMCA